MPEVTEEGYPIINIDEKVKKGKTYSYKYSLGVLPYTKISTFEAAVKLAMTRLKSRFPTLLRYNIARVIVGNTIPSAVDFVLKFGEKLDLTHRQVSEEIKKISSQVYWDLILEEVVLLEKPLKVPWWLLGALGLGTLVLILLARRKK